MELSAEAIARSAMPTPTIDKPPTNKTDKAAFEVALEATCAMMAEPLALRVAFRLAFKSGCVAGLLLLFTTFTPHFVVPVNGFP